MKKISINVPTNDPHSFFNIFLPSIKNMKSLTKYIKVEISLVLQPPWNIDLKERAIKKISEAGFYYRITWLKMNYPSMMLARHKGLQTESDFFLIADDNMAFGDGTDQYPEDSGERYYHCIKYLEKYTNCGFVMCEGALGGFVQKYEISSTKSALFSTSRGMVLRNIKTGSDIFKNSKHLIGGLEDLIIGFYFLENGYFPAKQFNSPTKHSHRKKVGVNDDSLIHNEDIIMKNAVQYIRDRYSDDNFVFERGKVRIPKKLKELFCSKGGNPEIFKNRIYRLNFI